MFVFLIRLLQGVRQRTWMLPAAIVMVVFVTSWPLMVLAERPNAPIVQPANYWWWFLITSSTVGYGDFYPRTAVGHAVGVYVIIGGIATLTALFARLATALDSVKGRRMSGSGTVDTSGHVVILGYLAGRTERIVDQMLADGDRPIVLVAGDEVGTHPMPHGPVAFVRGDLSQSETLIRSGLQQASAVLIDVHDDNEALAVTLTAHHVVPHIHPIVALRDMARTIQFRYIDQNVRTVQWHSPRLITEELQSPGITRVYTELMTHGGRNTYSMRLPSTRLPISFGDCQTAFGLSFNATVLAADTGHSLLVSPPWTTSLPPGTLVYYVSSSPLSADQVESSLPRPAADPA